MKSFKFFYFQIFPDQMTVNTEQYNILTNIFESENNKLVELKLPTRVNGEIQR
jgi:hypothetical protein